MFGRHCLPSEILPFAAGANRLAGGFEDFGSIGKSGRRCPHSAARQVGVRDGRKFDAPLLWMVVLMTAFGMLMIYSASVYLASKEGGDQFFYLTRQAGFVVAYLIASGFYGFFAG